MDGISILVCIVAAIAYFATGRKYAILAFISGAGAGFFAALIYAMSVVDRILR